MSFADFRMYASSLDDVITLRQFFHNQGIEVKTMAGEIERIKGLARGLSRIFWLVAVVGTIGCMAALIASFASSVERKRKDLGVMRLMGISGWFIFFIPVAQAIFLGCFGFITATGAYFVIAEIINTVFAQDMMAGEKMCRLGWMHIGIAMAATLCIAMLSALFASKAAVKIDPSEALRDE
jgi:putative ABC transport system permease protein